MLRIEAIIPYKALKVKASRGGPQTPQNYSFSTHAKILHLIALLRNNGPFLKPPYSKKLQPHLYELRTTGKIAVRISYTMINNEYYLLHAFKKKTNKTPAKEVKIALDRRKEII